MKRKLTPMERANMDAFRELLQRYGKLWIVSDWEKHIFMPWWKLLCMSKRQRDRVVNELVNSGEVVVKGTWAGILIEPREAVTTRGCYQGGADDRTDQ